MNVPLPHPGLCVNFYFNATATSEMYTLSLHDALPISLRSVSVVVGSDEPGTSNVGSFECETKLKYIASEGAHRSEEHTSELQSQFHLVCRLLLEKKKMEPYGYEDQAGLTMDDLTRYSH